MFLSSLSRIGLILIAGFGVFAGGMLSADHLSHGDICPMVGPVPACLVVFIGYVLMLLSALLPTRRKALIFYVGWAPVTALASIGVALELTQGHICPPGPAGIPQCFISLAMAVLCLVLFLGYAKGLKRAAA